MPPALHSFSIYEEIVAHTNLKMMTKLTHPPIEGTEYWSEAGKQNDESFQRAHAKIHAKRTISEERILQGKLVQPAWG